MADKYRHIVYFRDNFRDPNRVALKNARQLASSLSYSKVDGKSCHAFIRDINLFNDPSDFEYANEFHLLDYNQMLEETLEQKHFEYKASGNRQQPAFDVHKLYVAKKGRDGEVVVNTEATQKKVTTEAERIAAEEDKKKPKVTER